MPSNEATTPHFPWTKPATFWKVSGCHKRKKSQQQHLSFMEKHFNNSLLQLTFAVNQDCTSESITPKHSRSIRNQLPSVFMEPRGMDTRRQMPGLLKAGCGAAFQSRLLLGAQHPVELGAPKGAQNFVLSVFPTGQEGITNYFRSLYHTLYLEIISLYFFLS